MSDVHWLTNAVKSLSTPSFLILYITFYLKQLHIYSICFGLSECKTHHLKLVFIHIRFILCSVVELSRSHLGGKQSSHTLGHKLKYSDTLSFLLTKAVPLGPLL